jgi:hypothetical protein
MRRFASSALVALALAGNGIITGSQAADVAGLSWGQFITGDTSDAPPPALELSTSQGKLNATIKVGGLSANVDGDKTDASDTFSGQFLLTQPKRSDLSSLRATIGGLIVKTAGSSARIDVRFGDIKKTIEWLDTDVKAERFETEVTAVIPGGRIPVPFPVEAILLVKKPAGSGAVLLTVDSIKIELAPALVGSIDRDNNMKKPTAPLTLPAKIVSQYFALSDRDRL